MTALTLEGRNSRRIGMIMGAEEQSGVDVREAARTARARNMTRYQRDLLGYSERECGFTPWAGVEEDEGQLEFFQAVQQSVIDQLDGQPAIHEFSIKSCHGVGKTKGCSILVNWFFDAFPQSITITSAPSDDQVRTLLWKDIRSSRPLWGKRHLKPADPFMTRGDGWFAMGRVTNDAGGTGTARFHGQHAKFMLFVFDEADGVPEFAYGAVDGMMTNLGPGMVLIFIRIGNPATRTSEFHKRHTAAGVHSINFDALRFPNVYHDAPSLVPGGTTRDWVSKMVRRHCEVVQQADEEAQTFTLTWETEDKHGSPAPAGTNLKPNGEFLFRVRGKTPKNETLESFISEGRYEAACERDITPMLTQADIHFAAIAADMARYGSDGGTVYLNHRLTLSREAVVQGQDTAGYVVRIEAAIQKAIWQGAKQIQLRVDNTGGWGIGVIDYFKELTYPGVAFEVIEVGFGEVATDPTSYYNLSTELYAEADAVLARTRIATPSDELRDDLTDRRLYYRHGRDKRYVQKAEEKDDFKKRHKRSPDDGDGAVMALAPARLFEPQAVFVEEPRGWGGWTG
ncbi:hypothetical protein [Deinococcus marmoris]|uniref:hypothetical protein n=1 Tax=Deinococcus marmoris TaxID=249408 RepID=UPI0004968AE9|nr:hypothetical protein [Deinococcus marmoris]